MKKRLRRYATHAGRATLHISRWTLYVSGALLVLLAIIFSIAFFLLPKVAQQKSELEQYLSQRSNRQVRIDTLQAYWDGLHPGARITGLQVFAADGVKPAIQLSEVRLSLALLPLIWGKLDINHLVVVDPNLILERLKDGRYRISGFDPMRGDELGEGEKFVTWLFQQGKLEIENGALKWIDHRENSLALNLTSVNLSLRNNVDRHRLDFSAQFPPAICRDCSFAVDITGNPFHSSEWDGDIYLRAAEVNVLALPLIAREKLPAVLRGKFNVQLWSEWEQGLPVSFRGQVHVADLKLPIPGWDSPLGIREATGDLNWKSRRDGWRLDVANPRIGLIGPAWSAGHLRIVHQPAETLIQAKHLEFGDITGFIRRMKSDIVEIAKKGLEEHNKLLDFWLVSRPEGLVDNFALRLHGDWTAAEDFSLVGDVSGGNVLPYGDFPGIQGLNGHLSLSRSTGSLQLDSNKITVSLPKIFRAPLVAQRAGGDIKWEKTKDGWQVIGDNLRVVSEDGRGNGKLIVRVPLDQSISPYVRLRVDFQEGNGARAARYFPAYHLPARTLAWMESAFSGGEITQGHLIYDGPIREFPFQNRSGKFEVRGHVRNGIFRFLPGWEPVKHAEVDVAITGPEILVTGSGKIGSLDAPQISVKGGYNNDEPYVVQVSGKVSGKVDETLKVLREVKSEPDKSRWLSNLPSGLHGSGEGILNLGLTIPVGEAQQIRINGDYRFLKSTLYIPDTAAAVEEIEGSVQFTEAGIRRGTLHGRFMGGEAVMAVNRENDELLLYGQGTITAPGLAPIVGPKIAPRIQGNAKWNVTWRSRNEARDLRADVDLQNIKISLPPPFDQPTLFGGNNLLVRTISSTQDGLSLTLNAGNRLSGKLIVVRAADGWRLSSGRIGFGEERVPSPKDRGLHVSARLDAVDLDQWWPLLGEGTIGAAESVNRVTAAARSFTMFDRNFGSINLDISRRRGTWSGTVNGDSMAGDIKLSGKGASARYELDMAHLVLPEKQHRRSDTEVDPRRLPTVVVRSKSIQLRDKALGALDFQAVPGKSGWQFKRFTLVRPEMKVDVSGSWQYLNNKHASDFTIEFKSSDMGKTMEAFGSPDRLSGGDVVVNSHLSWPGSPANPQLANLNGGIEISAKKGRFLQVKSGAGRMFGLLDLSAIGRYLTLDFTPVFGKGFIFDQIKGKIDIEKGNAYSRDFSIRGPATQIAVSGRVGLAAEDYDLVIELEPKLSDSLTLASWGVWGPQVAAVVLAVQKIFKKQIAKGTRVTYVVKGPWENPVITKQVKGEGPDNRNATPKTSDEPGVQ